MGDYLETASYLSRLIVDRIIFVTSKGKTYEMLSGDVDYTPNLGSELAYLAGYTTDWYGTKISDLAVYQTNCYS